MQKLGHDRLTNRSLSRRSMLRGTLGGALGVAAMSYAGLAAPAAAPPPGARIGVMLCVSDAVASPRTIKTTGMCKIKKIAKSGKLENVGISQNLTKFSEFLVFSQF